MQTCDPNMIMNTLDKIHDLPDLLQIELEDEEGSLDNLGSTLTSRNPLAFPAHRTGTQRTDASIHQQI